MPKVLLFFSSSSSSPSRILIPLRLVFLPVSSSTSSPFLLVLFFSICSCSSTRSFSWWGHKRGSHLGGKLLFTARGPRALPLQLVGPLCPKRANQVVSPLAPPPPNCFFGAWRQTFAPLFRWPLCTPSHRVWHGPFKVQPLAYPVFCL